MENKILIWETVKYTKVYVNSAKKAFSCLFNICFEGDFSASQIGPWLASHILLRLPDVDSGPSGI